MPNFARARCRFIADFWKIAALSFAILLLFVGIAIAQPRRGNEDWFSFALLLILSGATPFYGLVACWRGCIEFDANGARWRTAFGMGKSARWDEIESCDARMTATSGKITGWKFVIRTQNGAFSWTDSFENADQLAPFAARFCPLIPPNPNDWPRRFSYGRGENVVLPLACLLLFLVFAGAITKGLVDADWNDLAAQFAVYVELYGWLLTVAGFAVFGVLVVGLPLLFVLISLKIASQGWRHRGEIFVATPAGLSWSKSERERLFAAWDELQILRVEARGRPISLPFFRLQSARGEFTWNNSLSGSSQLSRTLFERAPRLKREVQARLREELDDAPDASGESLTFDFKTRSWRAMLCLCVFLCVFGWGVVFFGPIQPANGEAPAPTWLTFIFTVLISAFTFYSARLFRRGCIVLDARGIEWRLPLRKQFVAWNEIDALILERKLYLQVGARRVALCPEGIYPARVELLLETIAQRATNAGGSWKADDKTSRIRTTE